MGLLDKLIKGRWKNQIREKLGTLYRIKDEWSGDIREKIDQLYTLSKSETFLSTINRISEYSLKSSAFLLITTFAFYPGFVSKIFWAFLILFVILALASIALKIFFPTAIIRATISTFLGADPLTSVLKSIGAILLMLLFTIFLPSPNYFKTFEPIGKLPVYILFLLSVIASFFLASLRFPQILVFGAAYIIFLYFVLPISIFAATTKTCIESKSLSSIQMPLLSSITDRYSCQRLIKSSLMLTGKVETIPYTSGIDVKIGLTQMNPLPAGKTFKEVFIITNNYQKNVTLNRIYPYLRSSYYNVLFVPKDYQQKKTMLLTKENYGEQIVFDPFKLDIIVPRDKRCKITQEWMKQRGYVSECSYDNPCEEKNGLKAACVQVGTYSCKCVDWIEATCSGAPLNLIIDMRHTGFLNGRGALYYFEDYTPASLPSYRYIQYPAEITIYFTPNPWFQKRYAEYIDEIYMFAQIKFYSKQPRITRLSVEPITTIVNIKDEINNVVITESIGIRKKDCNLKEKMEEINYALSSKGEWTGVLCTFYPPSINVEVKNLTDGSTIATTSVSLSLINQYCNAEYINLSSYKSSAEALVKYYENLRVIESLSKDIRRTIDKHGLCSYLKGEKEKEEMRKKRIIENNMKRIYVYVSFDYVTSQSFVSRNIYPYYTPACQGKQVARQPEESRGVSEGMKEEVQTDIFEMFPEIF
jgi:hypothetical protein